MRMNGSVSWLASVATVVLMACACAATPANAPSSPAPTSAPPPVTPAVPAAAPGQQILEAQCQTCHDLGVITVTQRRPGDWPEILQRMQGYGASVSQADQAVLLDYLVKTHSTPG
jgi:cytochrome c5